MNKIIVVNVKTKHIVIKSKTLDETDIKMLAALGKLDDVLSYKDKADIISGKAKIYFI